MNMMMIFKIMYKAGDFLYQLGDECIKKESQRVFIYTGYITGDGYGVLIGFDSDGSSGNQPDMRTISMAMM